MSCREQCVSCLWPIRDVLLPAVCQLFGLGVAAILGPRSEALSDHVLSMCDHKSVPLLETRGRSRPPRPPASLNLHPHPGTLGTVRQSTAGTQPSTIYIYAIIRCRSSLFSTVLIETNRFSPTILGHRFLAWN